MFPEMDSHYMQSYFKADIKQAKLGILLILLPLVLFLINDYLFFGLSSEFYGITALRLGFIASTVLFLAYFNRLKDYRQYYKSEFMWALAGIGLQLVINASRPETFLFHVIMIIIVIFVTCLVIPQTLVNRIVLSLTITAGELIIIIVGYQVITAAALFTLVFSLILANIIGLSISKVIEAYRLKTLEVTEENVRLASFPLLNPNPVMEMDLEGNRVFANSASESAFPDLRKTGLSHPFFSGWHQILSTLKEEKQQTLGRDLKIGNFWFRQQFHFIPETKRVRIYCIDITETKMFEDKLIVVSSFTRHDVRNKLMTVGGNIFLARKLLKDQPEIAKYLNQLPDVLAQIDRIFDVSKSYEMLGSQKLECVDVSKAVYDATVRYFSNPKGVKIINEVKGFKVLADQMLSTLFGNLIDDTLKYGEKTTQIRIYTIKQPDDSVSLIYEDDGVGIGAEEKKRLFEKGFGKGTGYGLFLVQRACEIYGWTIIEDGEPGKGAKFTVTIPKLNRNGKENYQIVP